MKFFKLKVSRANVTIFIAVVLMSVITIQRFYVKPLEVLSDECQIQVEDTMFKPSEFFHDPKVHALVSAAACGDVKTVDALVSKGIDVNAKGLKGITPLFFLSRANKINKDGVEAILKHGADPNFFDKRYYFTENPVIYTASSKDDALLMSLLLKYGGDPNIRSKATIDLNRTAFMSAAESGLVDNMKIMLKYGADINAVNSLGETALMLAVSFRSYDAAYYLLTVGADYKKATNDEDGNFTLAKLIEIQLSGGIAKSQIKHRTKVLSWLKNHGVVVQKPKDYSEDDHVFEEDGEDPFKGKSEYEPVVLGRKIAIPRQGEFAKIDVTASINLAKEINNTDRSVHKKAVQKAIQNPDNYFPTTLLALSSRLFQENRKEEALFWCYLADVRAYSDVEKSQDVSVAGRVFGVFQSVSDPIKSYAIDNPGIAKKMLEKAIDWDRTKKRNYDPRWVSLSGIKAFQGGKIAFEPESKWPEIDQEVREKYYQDFLKNLSH